MGCGSSSAVSPQSNQGNEVQREIYDGTASLYVWYGMAAELSDVDSLIYWLSQTLTVARKKLLVLLHILIKKSL